MINKFTVHLIDVPDEAKLIESNCRACDVLSIIENEPSRYSVQEWEWGTDNLIETLNGEEWLNQYTYLTKPRRVLY